jgi:hypothetical protein
MAQECYEIIKNKYDSGTYSLKYMIELVDKNWITKKQFQYITSYSYDALKKSRGW